jgi:hypothetical protein
MAMPLRLRSGIPWALVLLRPALALAFVVGLLAGVLRDRFVLGECVAAFWADYFDGALTATCALGVVSHMEGIAISLVLRRYASDVPTLWHAVRMRRAQA